MNMAMCYTEIKSREVKGRWYDMTDNMRDIILKFSQQVKMIMGSEFRQGNIIWLIRTRRL